MFWTIRNVKLLKHWTGEVVNYACRSSKKLFVEDGATGLESASISCDQFGNLGAWWNPAYLPPCAENLNKVEGRYSVLLQNDNSKFKINKIGNSALAHKTGNKYPIKCCLKLVFWSDCVVIFG